MGEQGIWIPLGVLLLLANFGLQLTEKIATIQLRKKNGYSNGFAKPIALTKEDTGDLDKYVCTYTPTICAFDRDRETFIRDRDDLKAILQEIALNTRKQF